MSRWRQVNDFIDQFPRLRRALFHTTRWAFVPAAALVGFALFPITSVRDIPDILPGDIPPRDIIAPFGFSVHKSELEIAREAERRAASVKPIYAHRAITYDSVISFVDSLTTALEGAASGGPDSLAAVAATYGIELPPRQARYLLNATRRHALWNAVGQHLGATLARGVAGAGVLSSETRERPAGPASATSWPLLP